VKTWCMAIAICSQLQWSGSIPTHSKHRSRKQLHQTTVTRNFSFYAINYSTECMF